MLSDEQRVQGHLDRYHCGRGARITVLDQSGAEIGSSGELLTGASAD